MIKIYTIGFTGKTAEQFFGLLKGSGVRKIVDTRLNTTSQLSGFAKGNDLAFFAREIGHMDYTHNLDFAPSKELLDNYRQGRITWKQYEDAYLDLLDTRKIAQKINLPGLHDCCLLCSEHKPDRCHRRLLAEYLQSVNADVQVTHLVNQFKV